MAKAKAKKLPAADPEHEVWEKGEDGVLRPRVGIGATSGYGSDSYPYTVAWVSRSSHQVKLRSDDYRVVSGSFQTGDAVVEYFAAPAGSELLLVTRRGFDEKGRPVYRERGAKRGVGFGFRRYYQDPSF